LPGTNPDTFQHPGRRGRIMQIWIKRAYEESGEQDGTRVLVDRIWPRGLKKEAIRIDHWLKDIAPSTALRKWFGHDPDKWEEFKRRYFKELDQNKEGVEKVRQIAKAGRVTLVYGAKEERYNNAVVLKAYLEGR
jgi:uncharacterized protein YeaO (DUF488 family)